MVLDMEMQSVTLLSPKLAEGAIDSAGRTALKTPDTTIYLTECKRN